MFYVCRYLKILIIYHAKDLWWFFESLDTFLLQHASESFTVIMTTIEAWNCVRKRNLSDINFPFSSDSNLLERIFHLKYEMSLRRIHVYLGMKWNTSGERKQKIIDLRMGNILNVKCLMFLIKKATRCETENIHKSPNIQKALAIIFKHLRGGRKCNDVPR